MRNIKVAYRPKIVRNNIMPDKISYPMRINRYLALKQICTRREADALISAGKVTINGRKAVLGDKIQISDKVAVSEDPNRKKNFVYLAYHKPNGIVSHSPQIGEKSIGNVVSFPVKLFPVGRLDKDSHGLIILTNDGRITDRMLNPDYYHEKEYVVQVDPKITPSFLEKMAGGVIIGNEYKTRECKVHKLDLGIFSIILTEGKKHQIRRMCEKLGRTVRELKRMRIMNIKLENLKPGQYRKIEGGELEEFLKGIGMIGLERR
jgi:23S rRNA pseudouridine2604 synthase